MIFKLLVADDEATVRKGIAHYMNWAAIDCEIAGTASDGAEAIRFLSETPVDIVITDIKMPEADGLDVARYVYENLKDTKVILLTGHAEFQYAQTAIRYNVSSFLLKPTNKNALFEAVSEAQKELADARRSSSTAKEELAFLREQALQDLTIQGLTPEIEARLRKVSLVLDTYYVAAFQMIPAGEDITFLKKIVINEKRNAYCYRYNNLIIAIYFAEAPQKDIPRDILDNLREIVAITETFEEKHSAAGLSKLHCKAAEFGTAVSEAIYALTTNFYSEDNLAVFSEISKEDLCDLTAENSMQLFQFENSLNVRNFDEAETILSGIFMKFKSNFVHAQEAKNICAQIYYICCRVLIKNDLPAVDADFFSKIRNASDIFTLEKNTGRLIQYTREHLMGNSGGQNKLVDSAVRYIHAHLAEPLSLEILAEQLHISPSHLSRTFKKVQEESITEYINKARVQKAREYLQNPEILTYEVAELTGYNDPTYFSSIFKKHTGVSPTDYRLSLNK